MSHITLILIYRQLHVPGRNIWSKRDNLFYCKINNYCYVAALTDTGLTECLPVPRRPNPALPKRFCIPETTFSILIISNDLRRKNKNGKFTTKNPSRCRNDYFDKMISLGKYYPAVFILLAKQSDSGAGASFLFE